MRTHWLFPATLFAFSAAFWPSLPAVSADKPCQQIRQTCLDAGFVQGSVKQGNGLIRDCIAPIMQGTAQPGKASKPLPTVDPQVVAACRTVDPNFGAGQGAGGKAEAPAAEPSAPASPPALPAAAPPPPQPATPASPAEPSSPPAPAAGAAPGSGAARLPNIIFILADDFSMNLMSSKVIAESMPNLVAMMNEGVTFQNYFVTDSLCCPSRSSIFTGKFPHDTGVFTNIPPLGGFQAFNTHGNQALTFAVALQRAGYQTAMLGKYLNGYRPAKDDPQPGWSEWDVAGDGYPEFNYALNQNGKVVQYGGRNDPKNYLTDVIAGLGEAFIRKSANGPFFIELATFAPHGPYIPAPRHENDFPGLTYDQGPSFGARADQAAPDWLKAISPLAPTAIAAIDKAFRMRVQSDQAIDDMIGRMRTLIASLGLDKNTYIIFSSDNGYHMGEYSLRPGKMTSFDTDIHVPLVVVGPGVAPGGSVAQIVENIDLCPTFAELAGVLSAVAADGHSLVGLLHPPADAAPIDWRLEALIEHRHPGKNLADPDVPERSSGNPPSYEALRTDDAMYVEYDDPKHEIGFYDLKVDPLELKNVAASLSEDLLKRWHEMLQASAGCHGADACWAAQQMKP